MTSNGRDGGPVRRLIQVGVTGWGDGWLQRVIASPAWELAAIVDVSPDALAHARAVHGVPADRCFASVAEAARAYPADAALVVTPVHTHLDVVTEAVEAGLDVLVEKPIADTMANAHELVRRADAAGRTLMVSQNYRFRRAAQVVGRIMREGWLGPFGFANVVFRKEMYFVKPPVVHGFDQYEFIRDCVIHHLDQIRGLLGVEPERVYANAINPSWSWFTHPPLVNATIEVAGGGVVHYSGTWAARGRQTTWDGDWIIECERGQIDWRDNRVLVHPEEPWLSIQMDGFLERTGWLEAEIPMDSAEDRSFSLQEFHRCLITGEEPPTSGADNLKSIALTFAVEDSARDGQPREIAPYLDPARAATG